MLNLLICKNKINNIEIDNAKDIDMAMWMYNLIEYSDNYSETWRSLWQYYKDESNDNLTDSESFKYEIKITGNTPADDNTKDVEIIVPLNYLTLFVPGCFRVPYVPGGESIFAR